MAYFCGRLIIIIFLFSPVLTERLRPDAKHLESPSTLVVLKFSTEGVL